jgi:hypothetical protein
MLLFRTVAPYPSTQVPPSTLGRTWAQAASRTFIPVTNLLERSFEEERRRTKVIPRLLDEKSAMKLVFATLMRCSDRWNRVSVSDLERQQLRLLRRQLGIDPEPEPTTKPKAPRRRKETRGRKRAA